MQLALDTAVGTTHEYEEKELYKNINYEGIFFVHE